MRFFLLLTLILGCSMPSTAQNGNIDSLKSALQTAQGKGRAKVLLELCWQLRFSNADSARTYGLAALDLARQLKESALEGAALNYIGITHEAQGNYTEALSFELKALDMSRKSNDEATTARLLNDIGIVYDEKGDWQKALEYYYEARRIFEHRQDTSNTAMVLSNIGIVLKAQKEYQQVIGYYREARQLYQHLKHKFGMAACDANLGSVYLMLGRYDSALFYSLRANDSFEEQNVQQFLAMTLCNTGMTYDKLGQEIPAMNYLLRAQKLFESYDNKKELASVLIYLGGVHRKTGHFEEGLREAERGLAMALKIGALEQVQDAHKEMADLYAAKGNYQQAFREHQRYSVVKDSLFQQEKSRQVAELQTLYETEKKENDIQLLTQQNQLKDFRNTRNELIIVLMAVLLLGLAGLGLLWRNRTQLKQQAEIASTKNELKTAQLKAVITSQEEERRRFAADLHDGMGQMISALRLNLSHDPVQQTKVHEAVGILNEMNVEIRKIAFNLMPQVLMNSGLTEALTEFANRINRTGMVQISVQAFDLNEAMSAEQKIALYRICQEWVNNVLKYSGATKISVQLVQHDDELVLTIEDNGRGFEASALYSSEGNGWKNINSRLGLIRGVIEIDSSPGREGTTVVITVPTHDLVVA
jgi:signal transduction histidine kinase